MAYMTRLGLWGKGTTFTEFNDFIQAIEKRQVFFLLLRTAISLISNIGGLQ